MGNKVSGYIRDPITAAGESGATVTLKKHVDDTTVASDATDANGYYEMDNDTVGNPGPSYETVTVGSTTKRRSGNVVGQVAGMLWVSDLLDLIESFGTGVLKNAGSDLAVSADGADMQTDIAAGAAILKDGVLYVQESTKAQTHSAADVTNPRIDRVILRMTREGQTEQGKIVRAILTGVAGAVPAVPALTQTSALWELSLAQVLVGAGVTVVAANKVTDERTYAFFGTSAGTWAEGSHTHGATYQPLDADLTALAGLTSAADKGIQFTGAGTAGTYTLTTYAKTILDDIDAATARATLGLGTIATQAAGAVAITGGTIAGITDLAVADGGTGASDAATARTNLGLVIGTNVQAYDADLLALAGLTSAADALPYFTGAGTASTTTLTAVARTLLDDADATAMRVTLGLVIGANVQQFDADLTAFAGLASAADKIGYYTGVATMATTDFTATARSLLDDASVSAMRTTLGLAIGTDVQPTASPTFTGNFASTGDNALGNANTDTTTISGKLTFGGSAPSVVTFSATCGTGAAASITAGVDQAFELTITCGGAGTFAAGKIATVTFSTARANNNYGVAFSAVSTNAQALGELRITNRTTTSFEIHSAVAPSAGQTLAFFAFVIG